MTWQEGPFVIAFGFTAYVDIDKDAYYFDGHIRLERSELWMMH